MILRYLWLSVLKIESGVEFVVLALYLMHIDIVEVKR